MSIQFEPYNTTTVDRFIEEGFMLDVSESTLSFKELINGEIIFPIHNVITKNINVLNDYIIEYTMNDEDYQRYLYQPKLFCYEVYGTPELASSILYINNMTSITQFNKKKLKIFTDTIMRAVNELMSLSEDDLAKNKANIKREE